MLSFHSFFLTENIGTSFNTVINQIFLISRIISFKFERPLNTFFDLNRLYGIHQLEILIIYLKNLKKNMMIGYLLLRIVRTSASID